MKNVIVITDQEEIRLPNSFNVLTIFNDSIPPNALITGSLEGLLEVVRKNRLDGILVDSNTEYLWERYRETLEKLNLPISSYDANSQAISRIKGGAGGYRFGRILKRGIDIVAGVVLLLIAVIVGLIIYPIVQSQSKGPLLFKQKRMGKNGQTFEFYKFRSMYLDAEELKKHLMDQNEVSSDYMFKLENDPRVFPFGQKIRDWSLDELPQAWNVLKGDMSLVGTRPPTQNEYEKYDWHHFQRLRMKPGITGMWQVSGRSNITDFEEVVALDMKYISDWSLLLEIQIVLKTLLVVIKREGSK